MTSHLIMGARISFDEAVQQVFITMDDVANVIESDVKGEYEIDWDIPRDVKYDVLFTGEVLIKIEKLPCYLVNPMYPVIEKTLNENQIKLFNQQTKEDIVAQKDKFFNAGAYETCRAAGTKCRPDPSLAKKKQKMWHTERRRYEAKMGYESMYPSEKDKQSASETKVETAQQSTKPEDKEVIAEKVDAKEGSEKAFDQEAIELKRAEAGKGDKGDKEEKKEAKEEKVDIGKEMNVKFENTSESLQLNIGDDNHFSIFGEVWDGFMIAFHHKVDNIYTIAATKASPVNGQKFYLTFPKEATAKWVYDRLSEHGDMKEQIAKSEIYKISVILQDELKSIACVVINNGKEYCNSDACRT